jgi:hypothetical protein
MAEGAWDPMQFNFTRQFGNLLVKGAVETIIQFFVLPDLKDPKTNILYV